MPELEQPASLSRKRLTLAGFGSVGLLALIAIGNAQGYFSELLSSPAVLDSSTPSNQAGLTILGILRSTRSDPKPILTEGESGFTAPSSPEGSTHIWIQLPDGLSQREYEAIRVQGSFSRATQVRLPYVWSDAMKHVLCVTIPRNYSDSVQNLNLSLESGSNTPVVWKINRLPRAKREVEPEKTREFDDADIHLEGSARIANEQEVLVDVKMKRSTPSAELTHVLTLNACRFEWGPADDYDGGDAVSEEGGEVSATLRSHVTFLPENHWVQVTGSIESFRHRIQHLTFRNVSVVPRMASPRGELGSNPAAIVTWVRRIDGRRIAVDLHAMQVRVDDRLDLRLTANVPILAFTVQKSTSMPTRTPEKPRLPRSPFEITAGIVDRASGRPELRLPPLPTWTIKQVTPPSLPAETIRQLDAAVRANRFPEIPVGQVDVDVEWTERVSKTPFSLTFPIQAVQR